MAYGLGRHDLRQVIYFVGLSFFFKKMGTMKIIMYVFPIAAWRLAQKHVRGLVRSLAHLLAW